MTSSYELIDPADGENQAVRQFLMFYKDNHSIGQMRQALRLSGAPHELFNPLFLITEQDSTHLNKATAQKWLRFMFEYEQRPGSFAYDFYLTKSLIDGGYVKFRYSTDTLRQTPIICGVQKMFATWALVVDIGPLSYAYRYCYENKDDAIDALADFGTNFDHANGPWIKVKGTKHGKVLDDLNPNIISC